MEFWARNDEGRGLREKKENIRAMRMGGFLDLGARRGGLGDASSLLLASILV